MEAKKLYLKLDKDFRINECKDDWREIKFNHYYSDNFKKRFMGLVLDNASEIKKVYTAVFPSDTVLRKILSSNEKDIMLFVHHPMTWDIRKAPNVFTEINKDLLQKLKDNRISVYNLHTPLDRDGEYGTSSNLARVLEITPEVEFAQYNGILAGIIGKTKLKTAKDLAKKFSEVIGHKTKLWAYGDNAIRNGKVAVIAGGGNDMSLLPELLDYKVNTFVTGITACNNHSQKAHDFLKENKINLIGGTHYSTEKFACQALCKYFEKLGLPCKFLDDKPILEDLE